ncbi:hypothetical protein QCE63_05540 [Caballeronia sp. LZ065]|uniref:hypothetical protein n=1 Tax=Caballeronia sp. LZ065 TaxID=3038571 RepID=UPI002859C572|nr:hypothetical protein [Caballeronia sp. LZ065]MDR5778891.1 hypothetical protein [Caballeronia sp. LZ065]
MAAISVFSRRFHSLDQPTVVALRNDGARAVRTISLAERRARATFAIKNRPNFI